MQKGLWGWFRIIPLMVGLMSGILSLLREFLLFEAPSKFQEPPLFWASVRAAFVVSAILAWAIEYKGKQRLQLELADTQKKYFDERPQMGLEIHGPKGPTAWRDAISKDACWFWLQNLSGRNPRSIRFDPILSKGRRFTLHFDDVPFLELSPRRASLIYHVLQAGSPPISAHDLEKIGDIEAKMLGLFLDDSPPELLELHYVLTARFKDKEDEERTRSFNVVFDKNTFCFLPNTD